MSYLYARTARLAIVVVLTAFLLPATMNNCSHAATYIVNPASDKSTDIGPGSRDVPFKTIGAAAKIARSGDTVIVKPGTYHERVRLLNDGTASAPITFRADPEGQALITGADPITGWTKLPGTAPIYEVPWNQIYAIDYSNGKPIETYPGNAPIWGRAEQVMSGPDQLEPTLNLPDLTKDWSKTGPVATLPDPVPPLGPKLVGWYAVDTDAKLLYVCLSDGSDPNTHNMMASTRGEIFGNNQWERPAGLHYIHVSGFVFKYGATFSQRSAVDLLGSNNVISDCIVDSMSGCGVAVSGLINHCIIRNCGQVGGGAQGDNFIAENCVWYDNDWKPIDRGWDAGGVKIVLVSGGLWKNCYFYRNGGPGLWFDIDLHKTRITNSVFQENELAGFFNEISRGNQIDHNLFLRNATFPGIDTGWNAGGLAFGESEDCTVTDNTMVGNRNGVSIREQGPRPTRSETGEIINYHNKDLTIQNNIFAMNKDFQLQFAWDNGFFGRHPSDDAKYPTEDAYEAYLKTVPDLVFDPTQQGIVLNNNDYYAAGNEGLIMYGVGWRPKAKAFTSLEDWSKAYGWDSGSISADPGFVNISKDDYQLNSRSSASRIGAGWKDVPSNLTNWEKSLIPDWEWKTINQPIQ